ncbi:hypothetical protein CMV_018888 [Castanea mollissima]|uniref:Uncharacterized protein n=1 Tax=Castanea mollissima TaxID=60419 RepID=A0A8J4QZZ1_9ROSI|nr:hypothetical protein CMV_018888 [Castanea mollissima]
MEITYTTLIQQLQIKPNHEISRGELLIVNHGNSRCHSLPLGLTTSHPLQGKQPANLSDLLGQPAAPYFDFSFLSCILFNYSFDLYCEASNGSKKERKERWNKGESNGCWEGVEANPPMGRNVGRNQNIEREDMIAELRRQVVALTEVVQRMQPPHETTNESDDSHSHFENPFGAPPRG